MRASFLIYILTSLIFAGCVTGLTESECIVKLRAYDIENLSDPNVPQGAQLLSNPDDLLGIWNGTFDSERIVAANGANYVQNRRENRMYNFLVDGTYTFAIKGEAAEYTINARGGGRWSYKEGILCLSESGEISYVYDQTRFAASNNYKEKYRNVKANIRVFLIGGDEMILQFASAKDMLNYRTSINKQNKSLYKGYSVRLKCGYSGRGEEVTRTFIHEGNKGFMIAQVLYPARYRCIERGARRMPMDRKQPVGGQYVASGSRRPAYGNISCERVAGDDFAFTFNVEILDKNYNELDMYGEVQGKISETVRKLYVSSFPNANGDRIVVDFPEYKLDEGRIVGRAMVLSITPVSLYYDPITRKGCLSVRFNATQYEEARQWIRKNIETLSQDKNIVLTTGQTPPAGKLYSLGEKVENNIMEIEFRTE